MTPSGRLHAAATDERTTLVIEKPVNEKNDKDKYIDVLICGLISEIGEVADCMHKSDRDKWTNDEFVSKIERELGDCMWYSGQILLFIRDELGFDPLSEKVHIYVDRNALRDISKTDIRVSMCISHILAGSFARYNPGEERMMKHSFIMSIVDVILCMAMAISHRFFLPDPTKPVIDDLLEILRINKEKLEARYKANKISGSGSDR